MKMEEKTHTKYIVYSECLLRLAVLRVVVCCFMCAFSVYIVYNTLL